MGRYQIQVKIAKIVQGTSVWDSSRREMVWTSFSSTDDFATAVDERDNFRRKNKVARIIDSVTGDEVRG